MIRFSVGAVCVGILLELVACGDDDHGSISQAQRNGVGAPCDDTADCSQSGQVCLTNFKGGYCGSSGCASDGDCPQGSACITHTDGTNYCFLVCAGKLDCNYGRGPDIESNCSSTAVFVEGANGRKACVPPSGS
jgi:hypothetical protein